MCCEIYARAIAVIITTKLGKSHKCRLLCHRVYGLLVLIRGKCQEMRQTKIFPSIILSQVISAGYISQTNFY